MEKSKSLQGLGALLLIGMTKADAFNIVTTDNESVNEFGNLKKINLLKSFWK